MSTCEQISLCSREMSELLFIFLSEGINVLKKEQKNSKKSKIVKIVTEKVKK